MRGAMPCNPTQLWTRLSPTWQTGIRAMPREIYLFSMSYILPTSAPFFCMLTSVRMRSFGMASNRVHLDRYRCTNLLFGVHLILHHNFMRFFGSLLDLVMDALDVR